MSLWTNSDGLRVRLGTTEAEVTRGGFINSDANTTYEFVIDLVNLGSASAELEDVQDFVIPAGFVFYEVRIVTETAVTGTNATLNIGLNKQDRSTAYDATAFLAAAPRTDWATVGTSFTYKVGVTGIGTKVGVAIVDSADAHAGLTLCADYDTAAFTAGRIRVQLIGEFKRPTPSNA